MPEDSSRWSLRDSLCIPDAWTGHSISGIPTGREGTHIDMEDMRGQMERSERQERQSAHQNEDYLNGCRGSCGKSSWGASLLPHHNLHRISSSSNTSSSRSCDLEITESHHKFPNCLSLCSTSIPRLILKLNSQSFVH